MAIVNGLITLAEAKLSIFNSATSTANDADVEAYIEAATPVIEDITGPMLRREVTVALDGGRPSVLLPWPVNSVVSVTVGGVASTDHTVSLASGIIYAGSSFAAGVSNVVVVASIGPATIPPNVKLATRELVRFWWQQGRQGNRPAFGNDGADSVDVPSGFAVPRRVVELCKPNRRVDGFA